MTHNQALSKLRAVYKAYNGDDKAIQQYICQSGEFNEWHWNDYGLAIRTTGSEYEGFMIGNRCPNYQLLSDHV